MAKKYSSSKSSSLPKKFAVVNKATGKGVVFVKKAPAPARRIKSSRVA